MCDGLNHFGYSWSRPPRRTCNKLETPLCVTRYYLIEFPRLYPMFTLRNRWDYFVSSVLFSMTIPRFSLCFFYSWQSWDALLLILFMWTNEPKYGLDRQSRHEVLSCVSLTYFSNRLGCDVFDDTVCRAPTKPERYSFEKWTEKRRRTCKKRQLSTEAILWQTCRWAHSIVRFLFRFCFRFFVIVSYCRRRLSFSYFYARWSSFLFRWQSGNPFRKLLLGFDFFSFLLVLSYLCIVLTNYEVEERSREEPGNNKGKEGGC